MLPLGKLHIWHFSAWKIAHLGSCHLGNCDLESRPWENAFLKRLKGTVVNQECLFFNGESLEIPTTVPLTNLKSYIKVFADARTKPNPWQKNFQIFS